MSLAAQMRAIKASYPRPVGGPEHAPAAVVLIGRMLAQLRAWRA